ncbi:MAG TPA: hypothetical protein VHB98_03440 [Chloroflexota bacterium]|nr:hypothetical protein [Chloroflexota bacterium]
MADPFVPPTIVCVVEGQVAFVVDDLASVDPWRVQGIEIRGHAEALGSQTPPYAHFSDEIIRIHPRRIISWGIEPDSEGMRGRNVGP